MADLPPSQTPAPSFAVGESDESDECLSAHNSQSCERRRDPSASGRRQRGRVKRKLLQQIKASQEPSEAPPIVADIAIAFARALAVPLVVTATAQLGPSADDLAKFIASVEVEIGKEVCSDDDNAVDVHFVPEGPTFQLLQQVSALLEKKKVDLGPYAVNTTCVSRADLLAFMELCGKPRILGNLPPPFNAQFVLAHTYEGLVPRKTVLVYGGVAHSRKWTDAQSLSSFVEEQPASAKMFVAVFLERKPNPPETVPNPTLHAIAWHLQPKAKKTAKATVVSAVPLAAAVTAKKATKATALAPHAKATALTTKATAPTAKATAPTAKATAPTAKAFTKQQAAAMSLAQLSEAAVRAKRAASVEPPDRKRGKSYLVVRPSNGDDNMPTPLRVGNDDEDDDEVTFHEQESSEGESY